MSREILAFGVFAPLAILYALSFWQAPLAGALSLPALPPDLAARVRGLLRGAVAVSGAVGVLCSVLIYHVTRRAFWNAAATGFKFYMCAAVLGLATTELTVALGATVLSAPLRTPFVTLAAVTLARALVVACAVKGAGELLVLRHLRDKRYSDMKRSAVLLTGDLRRYTTARFGLLVAGMIAAAAQLEHPLSAIGAVVILCLLVAGELAERTLFFAAQSSPGMPGGFA
jgi:DMSO reductase anchor subunit